MFLLRNATVTVMSMWHKRIDSAKSNHAARTDKTNLSLYINAPLTKDEQQLVAAKWGGGN
jgi:hypothetical protein